MESEASAQTLVQKKIIQSDDIKEIVRLLNEPPFKENVSLVSLDEMNTFDLGDLVFKIFKHLDSDININAKQTQPVEIIHHVTQFLNILGYQGEFNADWENGLLNGNRKIIYPIYYFLLKNLNALKKKAYMGKFVVPIEIPPNYSGDPQIKSLMEKCKELQAEFKVAQENFETLESTSLNPSQLKKQVQKLEQEREQLNGRISAMKTKHGAKAEMTAMLTVTNLLRKEQEEEVRIMEKIQEYRIQLENSQNKLMTMQQSLMDGKKSLSPDNSSEQMLQAIRNQVRKNREIVKDRMTMEYNQRLKKLQQTENMLSQPPITQNELMMLENTMTGLRRTVAMMEEKLTKETSKDDKLAIYKGQAALVTKKKEQTQEACKREEEDMERLEGEIRAKEQQINKIKGAGFKKDKFDKYLEEIKEKKVKFVKCKAELEDIKWERANLEKTLTILQQQKERYEKAYGLVDGQRVIAETSIQNASMEEINREIEKILEKMRKKKVLLAPKLEQKKQVMSDFERIENEYKTKKVSFAGVTSKIEEDIKDVEEKLAKVRNDVYNMDTKIQLNKLKNQLIQFKVNRLNEEAENVKGSGKGFQGAKSYQDYARTRAAAAEKEISTLVLERQKVSERYNPCMEQKRMFNDLKKLLKWCRVQYDGAGQIKADRGQKIGNANVLQI